jgi:hypothetical protein
MRTLHSSLLYESQPISLHTDGRQYAAIQLLGSWTGLVKFQGLDGDQWRGCKTYPPGRTERWDACWDSPSNGVFLVHRASQYQAIRLVLVELSFGVPQVMLACSDDAELLNRSVCYGQV